MPGFALTFYLRPPTDWSEPVLMLHDPTTPADLRNDDEALHLRRGHTYTLRVTPSQLGADRKVLELEPARRGCLVPEEASGLAIFKT